MTLPWKTAKPLISVFFKVVFTSQNNVLSEHTKKPGRHAHTITLLSIMYAAFTQTPEEKIFHFCLKQRFLDSDYGQ